MYCVNNIIVMMMTMIIHLNLKGLKIQFWLQPECGDGCCPLVITYSHFCVNEKAKADTHLGLQTGCTLWSEGQGEPGRTMAAVCGAEAGDSG